MLPACGVWANAASRRIFDRRIAPILKSPDPSSCAECHLGGVDLKDYVAETEEKTFASLRAQGLVDVKKPDESRILRLIQMSTPRSPLVMKQARSQEYAAFRDWIRASVTDSKLAAATSPATGLRRPAAPRAVIRHGRIDQVLERFTGTVWAQQQRCAGCHAPGSELNRKNAAKFGDRMTWVTPNNPRATLDTLLERKLINPDAPTKSMLLMKPAMQVEHGGGRKMLVGDEGYKVFRKFIEDYAAIVAGSYKTAKQLPPASRERFVSTEYWLKLTDTPAAWADQLLGVDLYRFDESSRAWAPARSAMSDRQVFGKGALWQHNLDLTVPAGSTAPTADLSAGRYRVKIYVDRDGCVAKDWTRSFRDPAHLAAEFELTGAGWRPGYGSMKSLSVRDAAGRR